MEVGKKTLRSILRQVQNSNDDHHSFLFSSSSSNNNQNELDLHSAIEYNYCLINSYVQERNQRKLSPYDEIAKTFTNENDEDDIVNSICPQFFLDPTLNNDSSAINNDSFVCDDDNKNNNDDDLIFDGNNNQLSDKNNVPSANFILEKYVLAQLPPLDRPVEFLNYLEKERLKLEKQQTIVSKRLTHMILMNDGNFQSELTRVHSIERDVAAAIHTCVDVRRSFKESKRDFTETSMAIIDRHKRREAMITIIDRLQTIKRLRQTVERIGYMLQYEKNFASAIDLLDEHLETLESLAENYDCVAEMRDRMLTAIQLVEDQMNTVLAKMCDRFCVRTYRQLAKAYAQIGKTEASLQQLQLHFTNTIHDKAFSIVLGYVKLFSPEHNQNESNLKRKPLAELCQHLNPDSFLQCLIDLCRALWDVMYNYYRCLIFYRRQQSNEQSPLTKDHIDLAVKKLSYGTLRIWSDVQHKIRTLLSSVRFVQQNSDQNSAQSESIDADSIHDHHQDQLLFSFEEFIKILTVSERMIEIGEQFCQLNGNSNNVDNDNDESSQVKNSPTIDLQNTLYQQTKAYIQSYHQVSMVELKIFLENEIWTRCPIDTTDEFELIANLQEFSFIKQRLLRLNSNYESSPKKQSKHDKQTKTINHQSTSILLSPIRSNSSYCRHYFTNIDDSHNSHNNPNNSINCGDFEDDFDIDDDDEESPISLISPFDELITSDKILSQQTFDDSSLEDCNDLDECNGKIENDETTIDINSKSSSSEIVTTNTALNVIRLMGRYMNIMFLLRPISHDIIQALLELFDYYFYAVYHFFAEDSLTVPWLVHSLNTNHQSQQQHQASITTTAMNRLLLNNKFSSFIKRINDTLIQNDDSSNSSSSAHSSPSKAKWKRPKYPCPTLPDYVPIQSPEHYYALGERIMAIQSMIFIGRQFYHLCPLLLEFLRPNSDDECNLEQSIKSEDGFKALQFYHDKLCSSVASLQYECLYAVATKLLHYEMIVQQMQQTRWDLKDIPSIHSNYVNVFINELNQFDIAFRKLLESHDLTFLLNDDDDNNNVDHKAVDIIQDDTITIDMPITKLEWLSKRIPMTLWECLLRASNRTFIEGFSTARKCSNEGRALMQLDYEQFISHMEKLMTPYYKCIAIKNNNLKTYLSNERLHVEEFMKAFYITESTFLEWIRQKPNAYTAKQIVSLINCIAADNKKLRTTLLSAIDSTLLEQSMIQTNESMNIA